MGTDAATGYFCYRGAGGPWRADSLYIGPRGSAQVKQSLFGRGKLETCGSTALQKNEQDCLLGAQSCISEIKFLFKMKQNRTKHLPSPPPPFSMGLEMVWFFRVEERQPLKLSDKPRLRVGCRSLWLPPAF